MKCGRQHAAKSWCWRPVNADECGDHVLALPGAQFRPMLL
jgi:hypothetical protein